MRVIRQTSAMAAIFWLLASPVQADCDAHVTFVDFGKVDFERAERGQDVTGRLSVSCDAPTRFEVAASAGHGSYDVRQMRGPGRRALRYNLYVDAARRRVWGDGIEAGTARIFGQVDGRKPFVRPIYGRILPGQSIAPGPYDDAVTVTVHR